MTSLVSILSIVCWMCGFQVDLWSNLIPRYFAVGFHGSWVPFTEIVWFGLGLACFLVKWMSWDFSGFMINFDVLDQLVMAFIAVCRYWMDVGILFEIEIIAVSSA